jgi:hypothetical protein
MIVRFFPSAKCLWRLDVSAAKLWPQSQVWKSLIRQKRKITTGGKPWKSKSTAKGYFKF